MVTLRMSNVFLEAAEQLPKNTRAKLPKALKLLTKDPRHPSLQVKKIQGAVRPDIYECRLNDSFRIILRDLGQMTFDLVFVGPHDHAISMGARACEPLAQYGLEQLPETVLRPWDAVLSYIAGNENALHFLAITKEQVTDWARSSRRTKELPSQKGV